MAKSEYYLPNIDDMNTFSYTGTKPTRRKIERKPFVCACFLTPEPVLYNSWQFGFSQISSTQTKPNALIFVLTQISKKVQGGFCRNIV